jgi:hypothetical protein
MVAVAGEPFHKLISDEGKFYLLMIKLFTYIYSMFLYAMILALLGSNGIPSLEKSYC